MTLAANNHSGVILVIDDNETNIKVAVDYLKAHGFQTVMARNGKMGLQRAEFARPDLIFLDVMMPDMDGFEVCRLLKANEKTRDIPVIFMTALNDVEHKVRGFELGAVDYITKPLEEEEVLARAKTHLTLQRTRRNLEAVRDELENRVKENLRLFETLQQTNRRMQDELDLAREIQYSLMPPSSPGWPELDVVCYTHPVYEVGGDFYQYHQFANKEKYAFVVGDVSGKGVSAALIMATSLAQLDASFALDLTIKERLAYLDKTISPYTKSRQQNCAMSYVEVESRLYKVDGEQSSPSTIHLLPSTSYFLLTVANAGCIPPYIKRVDGSVEQPELGGFALGQGLGAEVGYETHMLALSPGDMVILTSDGVVEANNHTGEMLGFERLEQIVRGFTFGAERYQAKAMLDYLNHEIFAFTDTAKQHDDMTIVVIQV